MSTPTSQAVVRYPAHPLALRSLLPADEHPAKVYLAGKAPAGRRMLHHYLDVAAQALTGGACDAETFDWSRLRFQHVAAVKQHLLDRDLSPKTVNLALTALKGVAKTAWRLRQMDSEEWSRIEDLDGARGVRVQKDRTLSQKELKALFSACPADTLAGQRDRALLATLYATGVRRSELVHLDLADLAPMEDGSAGSAGGVGSFSVHVRKGKGNKDRIVYATNGAAEALRAWLTARGSAPGPLFPALTASGQLTERRLSANAVRELTQRLGKRANVKAFSPHDVRASMASDLLDKGADLMAVSALLGHASPVPTAIYDRRKERAKQKAARLLSVPIPPAAP